MADPLKGITVEEVSGEVEWVSNELAEVRAPQATVRDNWQIGLNALATRLAMRVFAMGSNGPLPVRLWAGWLGQLLLLAAQAMPELTPYDCNWTGAGSQASPRLSLGAAKVLQRRGIEVPHGFALQVAVRAVRHERYGLVLGLDFAQAAARPVDRRNGEEEQPGAQPSPAASQPAAAREAPRPPEAPTGADPARVKA